MNSRKIFSRGFTLIELVIVIVILGILAASAAPKFIDLQTDARIATLKGIESSIKSALQLVKTKAIVKVKIKLMGKFALTEVLLIAVVLKILSQYQQDTHLCAAEVIQI